MKSFKIIIITFTFAILLSSQSIHSQMKFGAGTFSCNFDGDTLSFGLNSDLNDLYYMVTGGTADFGVIKIQWSEVKTPADVKLQSLQLEKGFVENTTEKISIIWADFYTNIPNIIKKGNLTVLSNSAGRITGTLDLTVELGGNPIIGEFLKGKKESKIKNGYFEINY